MFTQPLLPDLLLEPFRQNVVARPLQVMQVPPNGRDKMSAAYLPGVGVEWAISGSRRAAAFDERAADHAATPAGTRQRPRQCRERQTMYTAAVSGPMFCMRPTAAAYFSAPGGRAPCGFPRRRDGRSALPQARAALPALRRRCRSAAAAVADAAPAAAPARSACQQCLPQRLLAQRLRWQRPRSACAQRAARSA